MFQPVFNMLLCPLASKSSFVSFCMNITAVNNKQGPLLINNIELGINSQIYFNKLKVPIQVYYVSTLFS